MIEVYAFIFWFVVIAAVFHLVVDGIVTPAIRLKLRFELFAVRDRVRRLKIACSDDDLTRLNNMERCVNAAIYLVHHFNLIDYAKAEIRSKQNPPSAEDFPLPIGMDEDVRTVNNCVKKAAVLNSFGLMMYLVPLVYLLWQLSSLGKLLTRSQEDLERLFDRNYAH